MGGGVGGGSGRPINLDHRALKCCLGARTAWVEWRRQGVEDGVGGVSRARCWGCEDELVMVVRMSRTNEVGEADYTSRTRWSLL